ncbi:MAG TPA: CDC27 family protein [Rhabdochlamydiaceae bacterium]|nr:CDC27 family protein [Rhabdochlamydiaceae bacterium]
MLNSIRSFFLFLGFAAFFHSPLQGSDENIKICLVVIVKNDESTILRCLNSAKDFIDSVCICDVGSTDNTISLVKQFIKDTGIPGKTYHHEWTIVEENRTLSVQAAKKMLKEFGFSLKHSYLLTLNADTILKSSSNFKKNQLFADAYLLQEKSSILSYSRYNPLLLCASIPWISHGIVYEQWSCLTPFASVKLPNLTIEDQIGSDREEKLQNNIELLTTALEKEPENSKYMFYLAQSYKCLKNYGQAIFWYQTRLKKDEEMEEVWFSKYMLGECYEKTGDWDQALSWYLNAYQSNPDRAEPLKNIATYYRLQGQNELAYLFAKHGSTIPHPNDPVTFSSSPLFDYQFDEELSIAAYYTRFRNGGYQAASDLLIRKNAPWYIKDQTAKNMLFYVQNMQNAHFQPIEIELPHIHKGLNERYSPMNPSIYKTENGYQLICRSVNYTQVGAKIFNTIDPTGVFRTKNFLVHYDRDFNVLSQHEITETLPRERIRSFNVEGLEDCRLFELGNRSWFTCTTFDTNPTGTLQISLCKLSDRASDTLPVEILLPLKGPDPYRCEKNWLPFIKDNALHLIYSSDPFIIYKPNLETGDCETVLYYEPAYDFSRFRGSAAPIAFDDGYLMLVHEVSYLPEHHRCYMHRFLYLDKNFMVQRLSKPFTFQHQGVEFCCSMTLDHSETKLVLPIGIEDSKAYLCFIDLDTVRSLLHPLPTNSPFQE